MASYKISHGFRLWLQNLLLRIPVSVHQVKGFRFPIQFGSPITYTQDTFYYWVWKWKWKWDSTTQVWTISHLKAYCPHCKSGLDKYETSYKTVLLCSNCTDSNMLFDHDREQANEIQEHILLKASQQFDLTAMAKLPILMDRRH
ncbi:hypothetical protein [Spirosoma endbachense]|uniref:Uncharacterized protein n=1 Tax=Spirosoma endbachense TaxID=2666025 RepID=A0A6P1W0Z4_9BACT|nr:hypothetical protein [Spirosoma endbachense]QHV99101.1 hypothetical protein GJR95_30640 [Spirosoma endbachense]